MGERPYAIEKYNPYPIFRKFSKAEVLHNLGLMGARFPSESTTATAEPR